MKNEISICEYVKTKAPNDILIDLRSDTLFKFGSIEGAINIPINDIKKLYQLPKDKKIYLFCQSSEFSEQMTELLCDEGYDAYCLTGGYREYLRTKIQMQQP